MCLYWKLWWARFWVWLETDLGAVVNHVFYKLFLAGPKYEEKRKYDEVEWPSSIQVKRMCSDFNQNKIHWWEKSIRSCVFVCMYVCMYLCLHSSCDFIFWMNQSYCFSFLRAIFFCCVLARFQLGIYYYMLSYAYYDKQHFVLIAKIYDKQVIWIITTQKRGTIHVREHTHSHTLEQRDGWRRVKDREGGSIQTHTHVMVFVTANAGATIQGHDPKICKFIISKWMDSHHIDIKHVT